jgi:HK97 family phage prohead protease
VAELHLRRVDTGGARLKKYWTESAEGRAKWVDSPHPFQTLVGHLRQYVADPEGLAAEYYHAVFGRWPGRKNKSSRADVAVERGPGPMDFVRTVALDDIRIRSGGDGRTVEAYAAVFDDPAEVMDQDGHYIEVNNPAAFNKTIADRGGQFPVIYQHGLTILGTPSDRGSVPIGVSLEVSTDKRGVRTVSRYSRTELADEVLEGIRDGSIRAQSYGGRFVHSDPTRVPRGGFRRDAGGKLRTVTRMEVAMREFGPTPFPAFAGAAITGVRAQLLGTLLNTPTEQLATMLAATHPDGEPTDDDGTPDPAGPDPDDDGAADPPPDEPRKHSRTVIPLSTRIRAARIARGMEYTR